MSLMVCVSLAHLLLRLFQGNTDDVFFRLTYPGLYHGMRAEEVPDATPNS
jgi:hypothetical protein